MADTRTAGQTGGLVAARGHTSASTKAVLNRRALLSGAAAITALTGTALASTRKPPHVDPSELFQPDRSDSPAPVTGEHYIFFTDAEAALLGKLFDRIIPADELGPGAHEAGVTYFMDRQLAGPFGRAQSYYMQGPWRPGNPTQGYQSRLTPAQLYRAAIGAIAHYADKTYGKKVVDLTGQQQDEILKALEEEKIDLNGAPRDQFFSLLITNASEGYLSDPLYGGNRKMAGWKMLGFPGAHYDYRPYVGEWNKKLNIPPVGIYGGPAWKEKV